MQPASRGAAGPWPLSPCATISIRTARLCVTELQDIVYREDPAPGAQPPTPPRAPDGGDHLSDRQLFARHSVSLFGADLQRPPHPLRPRLCREVEGYPGLVVHGPLLAQHLMLLASRRRAAAALPLPRHGPAVRLRNGDICARWRGHVGRGARWADVYRGGGGLITGCLRRESPAGSRRAPPAPDRPSPRPPSGPCQSRS